MNKTFTPPINVQDQSFQIITYCPTHKQPATATQWQHINIPGGQASWWRCAKCCGWHTLIVNIDPTVLSQPTAQED